MELAHPVSRTPVFWCSLAAADGSVPYTSPAQATGTGCVAQARAWAQANGVELCRVVVGQWIPEDVQQAGWALPDLLLVD